jgi:hypothetical protein
LAHDDTKRAITGRGIVSSAESEARKALNRLRRAAEKARRELGNLEGALRHAEGAQFPRDAYGDAERAASHLIDFSDEEARRLQEKILHAGGLEPGRIRRS